MPFLSAHWEWACGMEHSQAMVKPIVFQTTPLPCSLPLAESQLLELMKHPLSCWMTKGREVNEWWGSPTWPTAWRNLIRSVSRETLSVSTNIDLIH